MDRVNKVTLQAGTREMEQTQKLFEKKQRCTESDSEKRIFEREVNDRLSITTVYETGGSNYRASFFVISAEKLVISEGFRERASQAFRDFTRGNKDFPRSIEAITSHVLRPLWPYFKLRQIDISGR